jgi:glycosyltransferase involved in cell wall biosynthesis
MNHPLISVKMITYNHLPYISQAIEAVLKQEIKFPFELVIGEDCSTDGTRELVLNYENKYPNIIRVIKSDTNVGMKKNSLRTLMACRGKYISYCEGDDYWHNPLKLQKQAEYLEAHPECGLIYSSYDVYHVKSKRYISDFVNYRKWKMPEEWTLAEYIISSGGRSVGVHTCTVMARRDLCVQIVEADPYLHQSEHFLMGDTQLWAEMINIAKTHYINESLATHNITEESATRSKDVIKPLRFGVSNAEMVLYLCDKYNIPMDIRARFELYWCNSSLRLAFYTKNKSLAEKVRRLLPKLSFKQWLQYYGSKIEFINMICRLATTICDFLRKEKPSYS